jgi:lysophospholipase L1-like esterase
MPIRRLMLLIVVAAVVLAACGDAPAVPTTLPAPAASTLAPASAPPPTVGVTPTAGPQPWLLVAIGDSIPFNSPDDCPGCTGFVDRYAAAIIKATGHPVKVMNLSQHTGLQIDGLLDELKTDASRRDALAQADIIVVSIGHNDTAWNRGDDPCDGQNGDNPDWSKYNATCATAAADIFRPKLERIFSQIVSLRTGKPTIFRTINVYNDWIGVLGGVVSSEGTNATRAVIDAWSAMTCTAAQANGVTCADIYHAFNGSDGLKPAPDLLAQDTTHPSDKGNAVIAGVLVDLGYAPLAP